MIDCTRPLVWLVTVALTVCSWSAIAQPDALGRAAKLARAGKLKDAEWILRLAADTQPDSPELHGALGDIMFKEQHFDQAVEELGRAVQLAPDSHQFSMLLAEALIGWQHFDVAVDFLDATRDRFEGYADYHYNLGFADYNLRKVNEAKAEFEHALALAPDMDRARFMLASCIAWEGDYASATEIFKQLVKQYPRNASYWTALGQMLSLIDAKDGEAIRACRRALAIQPEDPHTQYVTATVLIASGDFLDARPLLMRLEQIDRSVLPVHVALARVYARLGQASLARKETAIVNELQSKKPQEAVQEPTR